MTTLEQLQKEVESIKSRNVQVELNKAWETSWTRKFLIIIFTYIAIGLYLNVIHVNDPWINAVVPAIGFTLSTLALPLFKELWKKYLYKK